MKRVKKLTLFLLVAALLPVSCNDDFLNTQPLDKISSEATWADGPLSEAFIFNVYSFLGYGGFEEEGLSSCATRLNDAMTMIMAKVIFFISMLIWCI